MSRAEGADAVTAEQVDDVMLGLQALVGIAARSVAEVEDQVTLPQLRILMLLASRGGMNVSAVAQSMEIHASNASRACDRLVGSGLVQRAESSIDRRNSVLDLTDAGRDLIALLIGHRRDAVAAVLERVPRTRRGAVAAALRSFGDAAGEEATGSAWKLGWDG